MNVVDDLCASRSKSEIFGIAVMSICLSRGWFDEQIHYSQHSLWLCCYPSGAKFFLTVLLFIVRVLGSGFCGGSGLSVFYHGVPWSSDYFILVKDLISRLRQQDMVGFRKSFDNLSIGASQVRSSRITHCTAIQAEQRSSTKRYTQNSNSFTRVSSSKTQPVC